MGVTIIFESILPEPLAIALTLLMYSIILLVVSMCLLALGGFIFAKEKDKYALKVIPILGTKLRNKRKAGGNGGEQ